MPNLAAKPYLRRAHFVLAYGCDALERPAIPVAGTASVLGIDLFLSTFLALINMIGNASGNC
jgi:Na+/H+-dicarboxylate symporter